MCAGKANSISIVRDYQLIAYDYYVLTNLYVDNYMCSSLCPCVAYETLDPKLWGQKQTSLKNYVFTGTYDNFYTCLLDLQTKGLIQTVPEAMISYIKAKEAQYSCGGICDDTPMFYFSKSIKTYGAPSISCKPYIIKDLQFAYLLYGSIFLASGLFLMLAFNIQYGLWGRNLFKKMQKRGKLNDDEYKPKKRKR